jgi:hypothetical protein
MRASLWQSVKFLLSNICCLFIAVDGNILSCVLNKHIPLAFLFGLCLCFVIDVKQIYEGLKNSDGIALLLQVFLAVFRS